MAKTTPALSYFFSATLSACGYLHSSEEVQAWVIEQIKADIEKDPEYVSIKLTDVQLVRESSNKFTGFATYRFENEIEKVPISVVIDGEKKLYATNPPDKLKQKRRDQFYSPSVSMKLPVVFPKYANAFEVASNAPYIGQVIKLFGSKSVASSHLEALRAASNMVQHDGQYWLGCGCFPHTYCHASMAFTVEAATGDVVVATTEPPDNIRYWGAKSMAEVPGILRNWKGGNDCEDAATLQTDPTEQSQQVDLVGTASWDCGSMADCVFEENVSKKLFTAGRSNTDPIGVIMKACGERLCKIRAYVEMYDDHEGGHIVSVTSAEPVH